MSVRQYIGARYVTKIYENSLDPSSAEWEQGSFEPLVMVTWQNSTYLSKKQVPGSVGNPADNPNYWVCTGYYNGQIMQLQNDVQTINNLIKSLTVTPEMFGAAGDGVADDTDAFKSAVNSADLVIANGSYLITDEIIVPDGCNIIGTGSLIVSDNINGLILSGNNKIDGLSFTDTGSTFIDTLAIIRAVDVDHISVTNCTFTNVHHGYCVECVHSTNITVCNNEISTYSYSGVMCSATCEHIVVEHNTVIDGEYSGSNRYPICVSGYGTPDTNHGPARFIKCNYNNIIDLNSLWAGIDSHGCSNAEFVGNVIKGTLAGISLTLPTAAGSLTGNNNNILVENNDITTVSDLTYGGYCIFAAVNVSDYMENVMIVNNKCTQTGSYTATSHSSACISIASTNGMRNVIIKGNVITGKGHGISIQCVNTASLVDNVIIEHNYITGMDFGAALHMHEFYGLYNNIDIKSNRISIDAGKMSYYGYNLTPGGKMINYTGNDDNGVYNTDSYVTTPKAALPTYSDPVGKTGDFIPCSDSAGTIAGWICINGSWFAVAHA